MRLWQLCKRQSELFYPPISYPVPPEHVVGNGPVAGLWQQLCQVPEVARLIHNHPLCVLNLVKKKVLNKQKKQRKTDHENTLSMNKTRPDGR